MKILGKLSYDNKLVGIRLTEKDKFYDVDIDALKPFTLDFRGIPEIPLISHKGLLMTKEEINNKIKVTDISNKTAVLNNLFGTVQPTSTVTYNKGLAIIQLEVSEEASEYNSESRYSIKLCFSTKEAIKKACSMLGNWRLDKKETLSAFGRGKKTFRLELDGTTYSLLILEFNPKIHFEPRGIMYDYFNTYSGQHYRVRLAPPHFNLKEDTQSLPTGSCADGGTLFEHINHLRQAIKRKSIVFLNREVY